MMNIKSSHFPRSITTENAMKQKFVSVQTLQLTQLYDIFIFKAHYYNFVKNKFSIGVISKSFTNNFLGE